MPRDRGDGLRHRQRCPEGPTGGTLQLPKSNDPMLVRDILAEKGAVAKSVSPNDTVQTVAKRLSDENVEAMAVLSQAGQLRGIVSECDVVRGLSMYGGDVLGMPVSDIMSHAVVTCSPADSLYGVAKVMARKRVRHLPVCEAGRLVGLISIGEVLSRRLADLRLEADLLRVTTTAPRSTETRSR